MTLSINLTLTGLVIPLCIENFPLYIIDLILATLTGLVIAVKGHSGIVRPRDLEAANKKRPHSLGLPQAPSLPTHVTTPPTEVQETIVAKEDENDIDDDMLQKVHFFFFDY
jgi:hypothetical protein